MKVPIKNLYYLLCYAWNVPLPREFADSGLDEIENPLELLVHLLIGVTTQLLKKGLEQDYQEHMACINGVLGKVDMLETVILQQQKIALVGCTFDVLGYNTLSNGVIKSSILELINRVPLSKRQFTQLLQLEGRLRHIDGVALGQKVFADLSVRRHKDVRYYLAVNICRLLHDNLLPDVSGGGYLFHDFRFDERQMGTLFEAFVRNFYVRHLCGFSVSSEYLSWKLNLEGSSFGAKELLPLMKTDISLVSVSRKIIMEAKFYVETLQTHHYSAGLGKFRSSNLYQLFAYVRQSAQEYGHLVHSGMLLYPTVGVSLSEEFMTDGHLFRVLTLDLAMDWRDIHVYLLGIVD